MSFSPRPSSFCARSSPSQAPWLNDLSSLPPTSSTRATRTAFLGGLLAVFCPSEGAGFGGGVAVPLSGPGHPASPIVNNAPSAQNALRLTLAICSSPLLTLPLEFVDRLAFYIQRRFSDRFGESRVRMNGRHQLFHGRFELDRHHAFVNHLSSIGPDDMYPEHLAVFALRHDLHQTFRHIQRHRPAQRLEGKTSGHHIVALLPRLLLREPDPGHLRNRIDRRGHCAIVHLHRMAHDVLGG